MREVGQFDKAQQVFETMLDQTTDEDEQPCIYYELGMIKSEQGKYTEALSYYEQALDIWLKTCPPDHPVLVNCYNSIGDVYLKMGEYSKTLSYNNRAYEICRNRVPINYNQLAACFHQFGVIYHHMGEYSKAVSYFEQMIEITEKNRLPIIQIWRVLMATSLRRMITCASIQKHFYIMKKHFTFDRIFFQKSILIWLQLTTTWEHYMPV